MNLAERRHVEHVAAVSLERRRERCPAGHVGPRRHGLGGRHGDGKPLTPAEDEALGFVAVGVVGGAVEGGVEVDVGHFNAVCRNHGLRFWGDDVVLRHNINLRGGGIYTARLEISDAIREIKQGCL